MPKYEVRPCESTTGEDQECFVYNGDIPIYGPCTRMEAENVKNILNALAEAREQAMNAKLFVDESEEGKSYRGKIIGIEGFVVIQDIGRSKKVWHDISKLSKIPEIGLLEEISYKNGRGIVKEKIEKANELGR